MSSKTRRRLACGIGTLMAAAAASTMLATSAASATSDVTPPAGITVPGDSTGAPAVLVASLEGRNEVTSGATDGHALELIGIQGNTVSYSVSWRGIGTPTEAAIHAGDELVFLLADEADRPRGLYEALGFEAAGSFREYTRLPQPAGG